MSLWVDAKVTRTGEVIQVCQRRTANVVGCKGRRSCKGPDSIKYLIKLNAVHVGARGEPVRLGFLAASPIAGSIRGLLLSRRYIASRLRVGRSQQNFIYYSVVRLGQSPVSVFPLSCLQLSSPVINSCQSATVFVFVNVSTASPLSQILHQILVVFSVFSRLRLRLR